jgi:hypothetical protein
MSLAKPEEYCPDNSLCDAVECTNAGVCILQQRAKRFTELTNRNAKPQDIGWWLKYVHPKDLHENTGKEVM